MENSRLSGCNDFICENQMGMNTSTITSSSSFDFLYCTKNFNPSSIRIVGCTPPQPPCPFFGSSFSIPSVSSLGSSASQTIFVLQNDHTTDILVFGSRTWRIRSAKLGFDYMSHNVIRETGKTSVIHMYIAKVVMLNNGTDHGAEDHRSSRDCQVQAKHLRERVVISPSAGWACDWITFSHPSFSPHFT